MSDINKRQFNKKKTRLYNSRNIKSQNLEPSYDRQQKVLDVNQFIQSRDYEIKSFEQSQLNSKMQLLHVYFKHCHVYYVEEQHHIMLNVFPKD